MGFRENLKAELEYQGKKVKDLASETGISRRTIDQYLSSAAKIPSAETAVKIARVLNVSVEYLVTGSNSSSKSVSKTETEQIRLYKKYSSFISFLENCSEEQKTTLKNFSEQILNY